MILLRQMLLVTMTTVLMQEEYFAIRYFNPGPRSAIGRAPDS